MSLALLLTNIYGQSIGLSYESNSFNVNGFFSYTIPVRGNIKNVFILGSYPLSDQLQLSLKTGYGWYNFSTTTDKIRPSSYTFVHTSKTYGVPVELAFSFFPAIDKELVFRPYLSFGIGYYSYKTTYNRNDPEPVFAYEFNTKGFCQYFCLGSHIYTTKNLIVFFEFKHQLNNGLKTKWEFNNPTDYYKYESDYSSADESLDLSISVGFLFNI
jgi:hypothetical protein